jgi:hypothetical protein
MLGLLGDVHVVVVTMALLGWVTPGQRPASFACHTLALSGGRPLAPVLGVVLLGPALPVGDAATHDDLQVFGAALTRYIAQRTTQPVP